MADYNEIRKFAIKWCDRFYNIHSTCEELAGEELGEEWKKFGIQASEKTKKYLDYGSFLMNPRYVQNVIQNIDDLELLMMAVYYQWEFYHKEQYEAEITIPPVRGWFTTVLNRIRVIASDNPSLFKGELWKMDLRSRVACFGPEPSKGEELEQHLVVSADAKGKLTRYIHGSGDPIRFKTISLNLNITVVLQLFMYLIMYFGKEQEEVTCKDTGSWELSLTNTDGKVYQYRSGMAKGFDTALDDMSDLMRSGFGIMDLMGFDGGAKRFEIDRITINYHRVKKTRYSDDIDLDEEDDDELFEVRVADIREYLRIDKKTKTLKIMRERNGKNLLSMECKVEALVDILLDSFSDGSLFGNTKRGEDSGIDDPNDVKEYFIIIDYSDGRQRTLSGKFDRQGIPSDWRWFVLTLKQTMELLLSGDLFNPAVYNKGKLGADDYIYCSVYFPDGGQTYFYRTEDESIREGDCVVVPAGDADREVRGLVHSIEHFHKDDVPYPLENTKSIIRKCTDDEMDEINCH